MKTKALVVDLFGVVFLVNKWKVLKDVGVFRLLGFYFKFRKNPVDHCLDVFDNLRLEDPSEFQDVIAYKERFLPKSLCLWQKGQMSNKDALDKMLVYLDTVPQEVCYDRELIRVIMNTAFSSECLSQSMYMNKKFYKQLVALKEQFPLYLFSNIDRDTWEYVQTAYPELIGLFSGMVTSCESQFAKPENSIFQQLVDRFDLDLTSCTLIDDQIENCVAATELGMDAVQYTPRFQPSDIQ